jgi:hypothetical protein
MVKTPAATIRCQSRTKPGISTERLLVSKAHEDPGLLSELNRTEVTVGGLDFEDTDTIAVGAVLTW